MRNEGGFSFLFKRFFLILLLISAGFFCFQKSCLADVDCIVISEIYGGGGNSGSIYKNDFIELYNPTDYSVSLDGWSIQYASATGSFTKITEISGDILAKSYYLIQEKVGSGGTVDLSSPDVVGSITMAAKDGKVALVKNIEFITGKDDSDVIDFVGYGSANEYKGSGPTLSPDNTKSIERQQPGYNTDNNVHDFIVQDTPSPQNSGGKYVLVPVCGNGKLEESEECDDGNNDDGDGCGSVCKVEQIEEYVEPFLEEETEEETESDLIPISELEEDDLIHFSLGNVVVNEFVSDPGDGEEEWIEIYNNTKKEINLKDWIIEDGSGAKTKLEGSLGINGESRFFVLEKPKGNLNNSGDIIILRDNYENLIDQVSYGKWDDDNVENNAPVSLDPFSVARKIDGLNTFNNFNDFSVTKQITKKESNIIVIEDNFAENDLEENYQYDYNKEIIISEIFPNPEGKDDFEFIELYNYGEDEIDLVGWILKDESKKKFEFKEKIIKSKEYLVIFREENGIALNNGGDSVYLFQPVKDDYLQMINYQKAIENFSYNCQIESENKIFCEWSEVVTPGEKNEIKKINHLPLVDFYFPEEIFSGVPIFFDSSDTVDEDNDELFFTWDFGDGIILNLKNPEHTFLKDGDYVVKLKVSDNENEVSKEKIVKVGNDNFIPLENNEEKNNFLPIIINEILPNPSGADAEEEWIELKNNGLEKANLINWTIDDEDGGSSPYCFDSDFWLEEGQIKIINRVESGIALNNSFDKVRLFDNFDNLREEIEYEKTIEGESYSRGKNDSFFWTTVLTPGEENVISVSKSLDNKEINSVNSYVVKEDKKEINNVSLENIKELESGELVSVKGVVAVLPGVLGAQYFYIVGSPGIQIYNYKKDFPLLKVGDYVEVSGEIAVSGGEKRIKTKTIDDFKILEYKEPPSPEEFTCEKINEELVGSFVKITGEVVERKSSLVYLDDGTDEVVVYIKTTTGIDSKEIKEGDIISVSGIVGKTTTGIRIMPRFSDDIIKKDIESKEGDVGKVLGEIAESDEWEIAMRDKKIELFRYLLVIFGGIIIVLGGFLAKMKINK